MDGAPSIFRLVHERARRLAREAVQAAPDGWMVVIKPPTRNLEQNALMWARLDDLSMQAQWDGERLAPHEWKELLSAHMRGLRAVRSYDRKGFVFVGGRTSAFGVREMNDFIAFIEAVGAERGVVFKDKEAA